MATSLLMQGLPVNAVLLKPCPCWIVGSAQKRRRCPDIRPRASMNQRIRFRGEDRRAQGFP
jgi:hypothetical protein